MDKKIEIERTKSKTDISKAKAANKQASKKPAPKKTVAKEAKDMGLIYVGGGEYTNAQGSVRFINENGILVELNKDNLVD